MNVCRLYKDCVLEAAILAVLGQEVWLQKGEAHDLKCWIELGTDISHGTHPLSQLYFYLPVNMFIGCEHATTSMSTSLIKLVGHGDG